MLSTRALAVLFIFFSTAPLQITFALNQKITRTSTLPDFVYGPPKQFFDLLNGTQLVTKREKSVITIDRENNFSTLNPCKITDCKSQIRPHSVVLRNCKARHLVSTATVQDKLVLLLANRHFSRDDEFDEHPLKMNKYTLIMVNPWICKPEFIEVDKIDVLPLHDWQQDLGFLLAYEDSFDLFYSNQHACAPCRFNSKGEWIDLKYSLKPLPDGHFGYRLDMIEDRNPKSGYVYTYWNRDDHSEVKQKLNEEFQVVD